MKGQCDNCGEDKVLEPFSKLCVECLIVRSGSKPPVRETPAFDPRMAQTGERNE